MNFSEKLDLLMSITNTTNSSLSHSISLDASYISRLRRGIRTPGKDADYLKAMAHYFSNRCNEKQKKNIGEVLNISLENLITDNEILVDLLYKWLIEESPKSVENLLQDITDFSFKKTNKTLDIKKHLAWKDLLTNDKVYYDIEGKRNAVLNFLLRVLESEEPETLLLYSDEDLEWLTEDLEFTGKWRTLLSEIILKGNKIKIIHTVNRNLDEMLSAIKEWLPIYMTGSIEPYFYPKARDGVLRRTLFIAPNTIAMASNSIGENVSAVNFLYRDKKTILALQEEFYNFLSLCRPLMKIYTPADKYNYLNTLSEFEGEDGSSILQANGLPCLSLPMNTVKSLTRYLDNNKRQFVLSYHENRIHNFERNIKNYNTTHIINLPDIENFKQDKIKINISYIFHDLELSYTKTHFINHLKNIINLVRAFDNFKVIIVSNSDPNNYLLYAKEDIGVIVAKTAPPFVSFAINESNITGAFWDYMDDNLKKLLGTNLGKENTIKQINKIIENLQTK